MYQQCSVYVGKIHNYLFYFQTKYFVVSISIVKAVSLTILGIWDNKTLFFKFNTRVKLGFPRRGHFPRLTSEKLVISAVTDEGVVPWTLRKENIFRCDTRGR